MKSILYLSIALVALLFTFSCKTSTETIVLELPAMRPSSIYVPDSVRRHISNLDPRREKLAESYLSKSKAEKTKNLPQAIFYAKRAISLNPTLETYLYLAGLLQETGRIKELNNLYSLLFFELPGISEAPPTFIFGNPGKESFYEFMVTEIATEDFFHGRTLYLADELNYKLADFKKKVALDKRINLDPDSKDFKNLMLYFMTEEEIQAFTRSEVNFRNFISSIQDSSRRFTIDQKDAQTFDYTKEEIIMEEGRDISQFYMYYMEENRRDDENNYINFDLKHVVHLPKGIKAVVYAVDTSAIACPVDMRHIYHRLVTYRKNGEIISSEVVANQSGEDLSLLQFEADKFIVTDHKRTWQNFYTKNDFDNRLIKTEKTGERHFNINPDGTISKLEIITATAPDSLATAQ